LSVEIWNDTTVETGLYCYAVVQPQSPLILPMGIQEVVTIVETEQLAVIVESGIDCQALQREEQRLLQAVLTHDRVILSLFQQTTVLPLRFGSQVASLAHLRAHLSTSDYLTRLRWLTGKAEYQLALTAIASAADSAAAGLSGKAYLLAKKQRFQAQQAQQQQQQQEREQLIYWLAGQYPLQPGGDAPGREIWYLLSDRALEATLQQAIGGWQQQCPNWKLRLSSALPPYHFLNTSFSTKPADCT
jgi:hypothetical protein